MASASQSIDSTAANRVNGSKSYFQKTVCLQDCWLITAEKDFQGKWLAVAGLTSREKRCFGHVFYEALDYLSILEILSQQLGNIIHVLLEHSVQL